MAAKNARTKRFNAIGNITRTYGEMTREELYERREEIGKAIRELAALGRTERWQWAIDGWALMVERDNDAEETAIKEITWAFHQYSIFAAHSAD